jgi:GNAT superfamily N-acetyltransferase
MPMKRAVPDDATQLVEMMSEFYAEGGYPLNRRRAAEAFAALLADDRWGGVWLIQAEGRDVGYVVLTFYYSMEYGGLIAMVDDLFVRPAYRGAGLGTSALTEARAICVEHGLRAMNVETGPDNGPALALYQKCGFQEVDRRLLALKLADPTHAE